MSPSASLCLHLNPASYFRLATALENLKNYKKAVDTLTMGLAVEPRNKDLITMKTKLEEKLREQKSQTLQDQAEALRKSGDIPGAFRLLEQARAVDAGNPSVQRLFDQVKVQYDKYEKSRKMGLSPLARIKEQGDDKYKNGMFEEVKKLREPSHPSSSHSFSSAVAHIAHIPPLTVFNRVSGYQPLLQVHRPGAQQPRQRRYDG